MTSVEENETDEDPIDILERNDILLFTQHCEQVIKETMESHYKNLDAQQRHRIKNTLVPLISLCSTCQREKV